MADKKDEVAIKVSNVSKSFKLPHEKHTSVKGALVGLFNSNRSYEKQEVLKDISFEIKKGEFFGIVGRNGSGKSTLLKLLAGIYTPDTGTIQLNGSLTPFIELGVGFNPELTGRENVFLNGALLGFSRKEMEEMYDEIVDFAELEKFMDQKLKNYSSGMQVRLAFSIAIRADSDILLLDEVLAVGDEAFQKKCRDYFAMLRQNKKTVILVSHDMDTVKRFCSRALLIKQGSIVVEGNSNTVAQEYIHQNIQDDDFTHENISNTAKAHYKKAKIKTMLRNQDNKTKSTFNPGDTIRVLLEVDVIEDIHRPVVGITIEKSNQETIFSVTSEFPQEELPENLNTGTKLRFQYDIENIFGEDVYTIDSAIVSKDRSKTYYRHDGAARFRVQNRGPKGWLLHPNYETQLEIVKKKD